MAAGLGDTVADFAYPEPNPPPFTTIVWRMGHMAIGVFGMRAREPLRRHGGIDYPTPTGR